MFEFFSRKQYLKDLLENFVDIHCHILPGIDDGAAHLSESLDLIEKATKLGISQFIATPHIIQDVYPNNAETIGNSFQILLDGIASSRHSDIIIHTAAEYMLDGHFEERVLNNNILTLNKNIVLVEMSYFQAPLNLVDILWKIRQCGYTPVLAHPERYPYYHNCKEHYTKLKELGCYFQLNLLSLSNHYGTNIQKTAHYLMANDLIDFAGTDIHKSDHIEKLTNLALPKNLFEKMRAIISKTNRTFSVV